MPRMIIDKNKPSSHLSQHVHATKFPMKVSPTTFSCAFNLYLPQGQKCQFPQMAKCHQFTCT